MYVTLIPKNTLHYFLLLDEVTFINMLDDRNRLNINNFFLIVVTFVKLIGNGVQYIFTNVILDSRISI